MAGRNIDSDQKECQKEPELIRRPNMFAVAGFRQLQELQPGLPPASIIKHGFGRQ